MSPEEEATIRENLEVNLVSLAKDYPSVQFYYFFPPDCITAWGKRYEEGKLERLIEDGEDRVRRTDSL